MHGQINTHRNRYLSTSKWLIVLLGNKFNDLVWFTFYTCRNIMELERDWYWHHGYMGLMTMGNKASQNDVKGWEMFLWSATHASWMSKCRTNKFWEILVLPITVLLPLVTPASSCRANFSHIGSHEAFESDQLPNNSDMIKLIHLGCSAHQLHWW